MVPDIIITVIHKGAPVVVEAGQEVARRFQVLSLDGGGILGIFTAALLVGLEDDLGSPILDHFDLVVGTSTGGIVAAALGAGLRPDEIVDMYVSEMRTIFPGPRRLRSTKGLIRSKYRSDGLQSLLQRQFGDRILGESKVPLVIPSFDIGENKVYLFKTPHHDRLRRDWKVPFWQVAMATCAAPTFFPAFNLPGDHVRLIDGGVWANNPAMVGVVEAVSMFGQGLGSIRVLSLGTTADNRSRKRRLDNGGLLQWVRSPNVVNVLLTGQSDGAFTQVQHLIGPQNAFRLNPKAPSGLARLDAADARDLKAKAAYHSRFFSPTFEAVFADHISAPYRPLYGPTIESRYPGVQRS
jgi:patatin-like phospholipase/acyl hydrolase